MSSSDGPDVGGVRAALNDAFPLDLAEDWDTNGLLVGALGDPVSGIHVALECTSAVISEAVSVGASFIVTHHPLLFKPLKRVIAGANDAIADRVVRLLRGGVALYSIHTPVDYETEGMFADLPGWTRVGGAGPEKRRRLFKLTVFVPPDHLDPVRDAVFAAGAGQQGHYSRAGFQISGEGSFRPLEGAEPFSGRVGEDAVVTERRFETIVPARHLRGVLAALYRAHPYEEPAVDVSSLENGPTFFPGERYTIDKCSFFNILDQLKRHTEGKNIPFGGDKESIVDEVWFFPGSGESFINRLSPSSKTVLIVTGDIRYHTAQRLLENGFLFADIGHYGSEAGYLDRLVRRIGSLALIRRFSLPVTRTGINTDFLKNIY